VIWYHLTRFARMDGVQLQMDFLWRQLLSYFAGQRLWVIVSCRIIVHSQIKQVCVRAQALISTIHPLRGSTAHGVDMAFSGAGRSVKPPSLPDPSPLPNGQNTSPFLLHPSDPKHKRSVMGHDRCVRCYHRLFRLKRFCSSLSTLDTSNSMYSSLMSCWPSFSISRRSSSLRSSSSRPRWRPA